MFVSMLLKVTLRLRIAVARSVGKGFSGLTPLRRGRLRPTAIQECARQWPFWVPLLPWLLLLLLLVVWRWVPLSWLVLPFLRRRA